VLSVKSLSTEYPGERGQAIRAAQDVSFEVPDGKLFTLLGPSGCGKTTTLRSIAGLERPKSGEIAVRGRLVYSSAQGIFVAPNRRDFGMVFQSYAIWPHMNVFQNAAFPLEVRGGKLSRKEIAAKVMGVLRAVALDDLADRAATKLSGGQQQRLALARALVMEPQLLLLDEPLSNLDAKLRERMRFELKRIQRELGLTTVYVTHDQTEALTLSDRIAVVDRGRILQVGPPAEIYLRPQSEFVARFVGSTNILYGKAVDAASQPVLRIEVGLERPLGCIAPAGIGSNGDAAVSVRPEAIDIELSAEGKQPLGNLNELRGEIAATTFMGVNLRYDVRVADRTLCVITPPRRVFSIGDRVMLRFPHESAVAVPPQRGQ